MNKQNKFPHLEEWCKYYYETSGLKVHPSNVPVDVVLDEVLGKIVEIMHYYLKISDALLLITDVHRQESQEVSRLKDKTTAREARVVGIEDNIQMFINIQDGLMTRISALEDKLIKKEKVKK